MKQQADIFRLLIKVFAMIGVTWVSIMLELSVASRTRDPITSMILDMTALALVAGPLVLWQTRRRPHATKP